MKLNEQFEQNKKITLLSICLSTAFAIFAINGVYESIKTDMDRNYVMLNNYAIRLQRVVRPEAFDPIVKKDTVLITKK